MIEDNTPTVTARRRKASAHQRLRLDTAKRLQALSAGSKRSQQNKKDKASDTVGEVTATEENKIGRAGQDAQKIRPRNVKIKPCTLQSPAIPAARFRKRQIHKTWLPTHVYHAKRATMTPPLEPLWRFALPLSPANKVYRLTHRASSMRGAVAWDTSYMSTISLEGPQESIVNVLKALGVGSDDRDRNIWQDRGSKWTRGARVWEGWLHERSSWPERAIAPATIIWNAADDRRLQDRQTQDAEALPITNSARKSPKRQVLIRVQPAGFAQVWDQVLQLAKIQKHAIRVEDLRFEIGSIEITGPNSSEAIPGTLEPVSSTSVDHKVPHGFERVWPLLQSNIDPSSLPPNAILHFSAIDPRLRIRGPAGDLKSPQQNLHASLQTLVHWPLDTDPSPALLFSRNCRLAAQRSLPSQKSINKRRAAATSGSQPEARPADPCIPILCFTSKSTKAGQSKWTLMLPWKTVLPVWTSLMHCSLSCGGGPRFGGQHEIRQLAFEARTPWFPGDFPGTKAGNDWEAQESAKRKVEWAKKPRGRRIEYESIDLGNGRKGEIGDGWACDWIALDDRRATAKKDCGSQDEGLKGNSAILPYYQLPKSVAARLFSALPASLNSIESALITVHVTMLTRGTPKVCARIYRLPREDKALRSLWSSQNSSNASLQTKHFSKPLGNDRSPDAVRRYLAASILINDTSRHANEDSPRVPDSEDLIGFVTTGNYSLGDGMFSGIGSILARKVYPLDADPKERHLCIVRNSGETFGRLARWALA